jgi:hypothetical protein
MGLKEHVVVGEVRLTCCIRRCDLAVISNSTTASADDAGRLG